MENNYYMTTHTHTHTRARARAHRMFYLNFRTQLSPKLFVIPKNVSSGNSKRASLFQKHILPFKKTEILEVISRRYDHQKIFPSKQSKFHLKHFFGITKSLGDNCVRKFKWDTLNIVI